MSKSLLALAAASALLTATAAGAEPASRHTEKVTPKPGGGFSITCKDVIQFEGSDESGFQCIAMDDKTITFSVAKFYDQTGAYNTNNDLAGPLADATRQEGVDSVVSTYMLLKAANPSSTAKLQVDGLYSKLPAANAAPVVLVVTLLH